MCFIVVCVPCCTVKWHIQYFHLYPRRQISLCDLFIYYVFIIWCRVWWRFCLIHVFHTCDAQRYLQYWAKFYHNYLTDMKMVNWKLKTKTHDVHVTKQQPDPQVDNISCLPAVVPLWTTRFLLWDRGCHGASKAVGAVRGVGSSGVSLGVGVSGGIGMVVV